MTDLCRDGNGLCASRGVRSYSKSASIAALAPRYLHYICVKHSRAALSIFSFFCLSPLSENIYGCISKELPSGCYTIYYTGYYMRYLTPFFCSVVTPPWFDRGDFVCWMVLSWCTWVKVNQPMARDTTL